jgi:hypothetical protein
VREGACCGEEDGFCCPIVALSNGASLSRPLPLPTPRPECPPLTAGVYPRVGELGASEPMGGKLDWMGIRYPLNTTGGELGGSWNGEIGRWGGRLDERPPSNTGRDRGEGSKRGDAGLPLDLFGVVFAGDTSLDFEGLPLPCCLTISPVAVTVRPGSCLLAVFGVMLLLPAGLLLFSGVDGRFDEAFDV